MRRRAAAALLCAVALVIAACGDEADPTVAPTRVPDDLVPEELLAAVVAFQDDKEGWVPLPELVEMDG